MSHNEKSVSFVGTSQVYQIVSMALDLLYDTVDFRIPQLPNYRLQVRMGIHSGPAVGVVAGSKMPKYGYVWFGIRCYCTYFIL